MESFLFHPVQLDKKMNICYHSETQSPLGDIAYHRGVAQLVARVLWERAVVFGCGFQISEQSGEKRRKREEIASSGCHKNRSDHRFDHS